MRAARPPTLARALLPLRPLLSTRPRLLCTPPPSDGLPSALQGTSSDSQLINQWMGDPSLVDPFGWGAGQIGFMQRSEMYVKLHLMPGFDLPDFLAGSRMGYNAVTRLMYERNCALRRESSCSLFAPLTHTPSILTGDALRPLVSPACLDAMEATMEDIAGDRRRIEESSFEADDAIVLQSATLNRVLLLDDPEFEVGMPRKVHLDVRYVSIEKWIMHDYNDNEPVKPFDGSPFEQTSCWRWEGEVAPPDSDVDTRWRLFGLV